MTKTKELKRNHVVNQFVKDVIHNFFIQNYHNTEIISKSIDNPLLHYDNSNKKHVHFGPEGIGKTYSSLTSDHNINNNGKVFVISNSNKQSYERFNDMYEIQNHMESPNNFLKVDSIVVKSANEMIRELLHGNNKYVKDILLGKLDKTIEIIPYIVNENTNSIIPTNIDGLPKYISHISDESGYIVKYDMLINKLLFDIKKIFTNSKKNKQTIYDIFSDISINNSHGILLLYKVNPNNKSIKMNDTQYGKIIFDRSGNIREKLQYSNMINQINIDNDKPIILNISEYFDDGNEYYVTILPNRCIRNFQKTFENNEKITHKLNDLKFLSQLEDKTTYYFMEYYTFMNNVLIPVYTKFINAIRKLNESNTNTKKYKNIILKCLQFFENTKIVMDEIPHNLTNFLSLYELDSTSLNLTNIMETKKPTTDTSIYNHYYRSGKFKGERLINLFNNWDEHIETIKNLEDIELKEKLLTKLEYIKQRSKLNILLTIFDNVSVSTSELTPFVTLSLYGFDPFIYTAHNSTINTLNNNEITRLKESFEKIEQEIKDGTFEKRKFFKDKPIVELEFINDPTCKPINNNFKNVNSLISHEKLDLDNKKEFLSVGNNLYNTDITFESLKGSNNERDRNNSQKITINDSLNISPYIKKIVGICSPNNPTKMLKSTLLFKEAIECFINDTTNTKLSNYPKIKDTIKEFYEWISKDKESLIDIDIILSFMQYADNINQVIGRFGYPRIIDENIKIPYMKFLIPILKRKNYDLTYLLIDIVRERYPNFTQYTIREDIDIYSIRENIMVIQNKYGNTIKSIEKFLLLNPLQNIDLKYTDQYKSRVNLLIEYLKKNRYLKPEYMRSIYILMKGLFNSIVDDVNDEKFNQLCEEFKLSYFYQKIRYKNINKTRNKLEKRLSEIYNEINQLKNSSDSNAKLKIRQLLESTLPKVFELDYENGQDIIRLNMNISNKEEMVKTLKRDERKKLRSIDGKLLFSKYLYNLKLNIFISLLSSINKISMFDDKIDNILTRINNEIFDESLLYFSNSLIIQIATNILDISFEYKEGLVLTGDLKDKLINIDKEFEHLLSYPNINLSMIKEKLKKIKKEETEIINDMKEKITSTEIKMTPNIDGTFLLNIFKNRQDPFRYLTKYTSLNEFVVNRKEVIDHFDFNNKELDVNEEIIKNKIIRHLSTKLKEEQLLVYDIAKNYSNHIFMPFILSKEKQKPNLDNLITNQTIVNDYIFDCMFKIQYTRELDLKLYSNVPYQLFKNMVSNIFEKHNDKDVLDKYIDNIKEEFNKTKPALGQSTTSLHTYNKINKGNRINKNLTKQFLLNDNYIRQNIQYAFNYTDSNFKTHAMREAFNLCKIDNKKKIVNLNILSDNIFNTISNILNKFKLTKDINYLLTLAKVGLFKLSDNNVTTFKPLNDILPIVNDIIDPNKIDKLKEFYFTNFKVTP